MSHEGTYYSDNIIQVTNTRVIIEGKTYAMSNITSVTMGKIPPDRTFAILLAVFGLLSILCASTGPEMIVMSCGLLLLIIGIALVYRAKTEYIVRIGSSSGEADVLSSFDRAYIEKIVNAINQAIIGRG